MPMAIQGQYICLDRGDLPVKMNVDNVRRLKHRRLNVRLLEIFSGTQSVGEVTKEML